MSENSKHVCVYPGSFDPFTLGHLDILNRARNIFDKVHIAVAYNTEKKSAFSTEERIEMIKRICEGMNDVDVLSFHGLTTDLLKEMGVNILLRGIRDANDFLYESKLSRMNHILHPKMETVFLHTHEKYAHISSSLAKEVAQFGGQLSDILPDEIIEDVENFIKKNS